MFHAGTDAAYELAIRRQARVGWGTDILFAPGATDRQRPMLAATRRWRTPTQVLTMATSEDADLLSLSGRPSAYPARLGFVDKDALRSCR
jgi:imidazolonepropionase-like amidohydrolase